MKMILDVPFRIQLVKNKLEYLDERISKAESEKEKLLAEMAALNSLNEIYATTPDLHETKDGSIAQRIVEVLQERGPSTVQEISDAIDGVSYGSITNTIYRMKQDGILIPPQKRTGPYRLR